MTASPVAVVTGTASGIGRAVALDLVGRGWLVAGIDRSPSPECTTWAEADVTDEAAVLAAVEQAETQLGAVTAAVSVAGYYEMSPVADITREAWRRMLRVHLGGLVHLARAALPAMVARGDGSLVAIASELAIGGGSEDVHYASAKGAVIGAVRSLAVEMAPHGVRVNVVAPGPTDTPLLPADSPWRAPDYLRTLPLGRLVRPDEVSRCVRFLVEEGSFCVGEVLNPNAGAVI
ncbi:MAG: SDR family oxidoreductase [Actinomycetota bacterium]|nr:SDR family oxidoreductase [Actinomycetota bacterium]